MDFQNSILHRKIITQKFKNFDAHEWFSLAELRLDSEIIGNFRNFEKFFDHFVERQK